MTCLTSLAIITRRGALRGIQAESRADSMVGYCTLEERGGCAGLGGDHMSSTCRESSDRRRACDYRETVGADHQDSLFYAVFTDQPGSDTPKTDPKDYVLAGVMGQISSSYADSTAEPGFIMILKPFQVSQKWNSD
jgi:hypothetical protein